MCAQRDRYADTLHRPPPSLARSLSAALLWSMIREASGGYTKGYYVVIGVSLVVLSLIHWKVGVFHLIIYIEVLVFVVVIILDVVHLMIRHRNTHVLVFEHCNLVVINGSGGFVILERIRHHKIHPENRVAHFDLIPQAQQHRLLRSHLVLRRRHTSTTPTQTRCESDPRVRRRRWQQCKHWVPACTGQNNGARPCAGMRGVGRLHKST